MGVVDRVQKLIALSASENENESRNAASAACKLIREHRLILSSPRNEIPSWVQEAANVETWRYVSVDWASKKGPTPDGRWIQIASEAYWCPAGCKEQIESGYVWVNEVTSQRRCDVCHSRST